MPGAYAAPLLVRASGRSLRLVFSNLGLRTGSVFTDTKKVILLANHRAVPACFAMRHTVARLRSCHRRAEQSKGLYLSLSDPGKAACIETQQAV
jgi:hypothetical protein